MLQLRLVIVLHMVMGLTDLKIQSAIGPIRHELANQNTATGKTLVTESTLNLI